MKYIDGFNYRIIKKIAALNRLRFGEKIRKTKDWKSFLNISDFGKNDFEFVSFSSSRDLEEQMLSILSLIKWYGHPQKWTIYSDGSHTEEDKEILKLLGSFIVIKKWNDCLDNINHDKKDFLFQYAKSAPLGKKLSAFISHSITCKTAFLDSDIVFYKNIKDTLDLVNSSEFNWFTVEVEWGTLDTRYKIESPKELYQINSGFSIINKDFNWTQALDFISTLNNQFEYFSEQTAFHIAMKNQNSYPLDPRKFMLHSSDQFSIRTLQNNSSIAIRHFVSPVRHKMWQNGVEWHLKS